MLKLDMEGTFGDSSNYKHQIGLIGNPVVDTETKKVGNSSARFDSNSPTDHQGLYIPSLSRKQIISVSQNFTIQFWINFRTTLINYANIFSAGNLVISQISKQNPDGQSRQTNLRVTIYNVSVPDQSPLPDDILTLTCPVDIVPNKWYHVALTRSDDNYTRFFVDGVLYSRSPYAIYTVGSTNSDTVISSQEYQSNGSGAMGIRGNIDQFEILYISLYDQDFNVNNIEYTTCNSDTPPPMILSNSVY